MAAQPQTQQLRPVRNPAPAQHEINQCRDPRSCTAHKAMKIGSNARRLSRVIGKVKLKQSTPTSVKNQLRHSGDLFGQARHRARRSTMISPEQRPTELLPEQIQFAKNSTRTVCTPSGQVPSVSTRNSPFTVRPFHRYCRTLFTRRHAAPTPTRRYADTIPRPPTWHWPIQSRSKSRQTFSPRRSSAIGSIPLRGSPAERGNRPAHTPGSRGPRRCRSQTQKWILYQVQKPIAGTVASAAPIESIAG